MGLSVRSVQNTDNLGDVVNQINITNNEMTEDFNLLKTKLALREQDIDDLKRTIDSLSIKLGEFSASTKNNQSVQKKVIGKNYKYGITEDSTVGTNTLFRGTSGSLIWSDDNGLQTPIVA